MRLTPSRTKTFTVPAHFPLAVCVVKCTIIPEYQTSQCVVGTSESFVLAHLDVVRRRTIIM